jgi:hypothetical protein
MPPAFHRRGNASTTKPAKFVVVFIKNEDVPALLPVE